MEKQSPAPGRSTEARAVLDLVSQLVEPLAEALGGEVVLHDLTHLPDSVHAIAGGLTDRSVGAPATDLLLAHTQAGAETNIIGYATELPGNREGRSSTIIVRLPSDGTPVAALCLNIDVTDLRDAHRLLGSLLANGSDEPQPRREQESFPRSVGELTVRMIREAVDDAGVPVSLMKKQHKIQVVSTLRDRGVFQVKDSVEAVADAIEVSRFTVYNYLNELDEQPDSEGKA